MVRDAMVWFVWYEFIRFIYDPGAGCTLSLGFMCQVSDASNWARRRFRAWSCSGSTREEARQTKHDKTTRLCQQLVTSFRTSILLVQRWLEMSCGHPKVFLAIFVWHNFGKDFQQADAIRSQLQDIRPFGWVFSTSKSILSILSILSISILLCILCAFYVHSMVHSCQDLGVELLDKEKLWKCPGNAGQSSFFCEGKEALDELRDEKIIENMEKTWRIR